MSISCRAHPVPRLFLRSSCAMRCLGCRAQTDVPMPPSVGVACLYSGAPAVVGASCLIVLALGFAVRNAAAAARSAISLFSDGSTAVHPLTLAEWASAVKDCVAGAVHSETPCDHDVQLDTSSKAGASSPTSCAHTAERLPLEPSFSARAQMQVIARTQLGSGR